MGIFSGLHSPPPVQQGSKSALLSCPALPNQLSSRYAVACSILAAARQEAAGRQHSRDEQRQRREQRQAPTLAKRRADAAARAAAWLAEEGSPSRTAEARCNGGIQSPQQAGRQAASAAAASGSQELPGGRSRRQLQLEEQACEGSDTQQDGGPGSLTQGPQTQEPADPARRLFGDDSPVPAAAEAAAEAAAAEAEAATAVDEAAAAAEEAIPWLAGLDLEVQVSSGGGGG